MEPKTIKTTKPLSKEETKGLLSLVEESKIINNKKINANSNRMKVLEWRRITEIFNSSIGTCRRTPQQLRLKWENLKKNSRRRSTLIRMERTKTGGEPPRYIPPKDEILDRVAAILGSTREGLTERFGGNAEPQIIGDDEGSVTTAYIMPENISPMQLIDCPLPLKSSLTSTDYTSMSMGSGVPVTGIRDELTLGNINTGIDPKEKINRTSCNVNRKLLKPDNGCQARNSAIAEYYNVKKKMIESKNESIKLQNENIKLQNENIKLRNKKLTLEIRKLKGDDND